MPVQNQNVECYAGDTLLMRVTVYDMDQSPPQLLDLAGASILYIVRKVMPPKTAIIDLTEQSAELTVTGLGTLEIDLPQSATRGKDGKYEHQCRVVLPSGAASTIFEGDFQILRSLF